VTHVPPEGGLVLPSAQDPGPPVAVGRAEPLLVSRRTWAGLAGTALAFTAGVTLFAVWHDVARAVACAVVVVLLAVMVGLVVRHRRGPAVTLDRRGLRPRHRLTPIPWAEVARVGVVVISVADTAEDLEAGPRRWRTVVLLGFDPAGRRRHTRRFALGPDLPFVYGYPLVETATGEAAASGPARVVTQTVTTTAAALARFAPTLAEPPGELGPIRSGAVFSRRLR